MPLLNGSQKSRREAGEGTTNRLSKPSPEDVSASWVATSLVATEAPWGKVAKQRNSAWSESCNVILSGWNALDSLGFKVKCKTLFELAGPPKNYTLALMLSQRKISKTSYRQVYKHTMVLGTKPDSVANSWGDVKYELYSHSCHKGAVINANVL